MAKIKAITEEESKNIITHFHKVTNRINNGRSSCCDYPLVPSPYVSDEDIKNGCSRYCCKCNTYCAWL